MPRKSRKNVGLIGLGIIGARAAASLRAAGWHVFVWNRTPKPVANFLGSPAEVADICEIIQLFVADAQAVFAMIEVLGDSLTERHIVVCSATIGPEATMEAARLVEARGAKFLDAPFTGSRGAAERAQLVYYIGGDEAVYARAKPVLEASSKAIVRCGRVGDAATLKVVTNLITAVTTQTLAEALAITRRAGIGPDVFAAAIEQNACRSGVIELKLPKMVTGDYEPHFSLKHMFKDVQLGIHLANALDLEVPVTTVTAGVMYGAINQGWADLDFSSVFRTYENEFARLALRAELAAPKQEEMMSADFAGEIPRDAAAPAPVVIPMEIIPPPGQTAGEDALQGSLTNTEQAQDAKSPELPTAGDFESKPAVDQAPAENAAKDISANHGTEAKAEEPTQEPMAPHDGPIDAAKPLEAKPEVEKPSEENAGEIKPVEAKVDAPKPETVNADEPQAEAAKNTNGEAMPPKIEGEGEAASKPAHPFNRILRRFFSPAGK